jgi:hypothetical protein
MTVPLSPRTWAMLTWYRAMLAGPKAVKRWLASPPSRVAVAFSLADELAGSGPVAVYRSGIRGGFEERAVHRQLIRASLALGLDVMDGAH